ncbi:MAG: Ig-like domain-containing protein [Micrococcales bacterium]|nr:Ig-like domain-containing protein [Micrococcales bacterium]
MRSKTARVLFSALLVTTLGVVVASTVSAIPRVSPTSGPADGGTGVSGELQLRVTAIAAQGDTRYWLDKNGDIWASGPNQYGQLGNGTTTRSSWPALVQAATGTLPGFTAIAAGDWTGYALDGTGNVWAWGRGDSGRLGNGTTSGSSRPVQVQAAPGRTLPPFTAVAAGYGLDRYGDIWAWGDNYYGQLGNGTGGPGSYSSNPVRVQAATGTLPVFTAIAGGYNTGYGLDVDGNVWAWGYNNVGQLGNGTTTSSTRPVRVQAATGTTLPRFTAIAAVTYVGYALDENGSVWAWGWNTSGQLGNGTSGTTTSSTRPVRVQAATGTTLPVFTQIAGGSATGYALDVDGTVWAWGNNNYGQLGIGTTTNSSRPVRVQAATGTLPAFTAIAGGEQTGYALDETGNVWAWGDDIYGTSGNGTTTHSQRAVLVSPTASAVTFGGVPGTDLTTDSGMWSATTRAGCGTVPVVVTYRAGMATRQVTQAEGFVFGEPPAIKIQPTGGVVVPGELFATSVVVSGDPTPIIRWQLKVGTGSWVSVPEVTGTTLAVKPTVSTQYRAVVTNCWTDLDEVAYTAYSAKATVTLAASSPSTADPPASPNTTKAPPVSVAMSKVTMVKNTTLKVVQPPGLAGGGVWLSWSSSNRKVATVNTKGVITALQPGRAVITVSTPAGGVAKLTVTVVSKAVKAKAVQATLKGAGVKGSKTGTTKMKVGKTARLSVQPSPAGATLKKMPTFKSSKPKVASVDRSGLITAKKKGKAKITIRLAGKKTAIVIHVT